MSFYADICNKVEVSYMTNTHKSFMGTMHYHNAYEIYILEKGSRVYVIDDTLIELSDGDVALIKPQHVHATDGGAYKRYLINFRQEFLDSYFTPKAAEKILKCFDYEKIHLSPALCDKVITLMKKIEYDNEDFISFCKMMEILSLAATTSTPDIISRKNVLISEIIEYIGKNYREINSLDEIASKFYITKYYLCRLFKENTGIPVMKYINTLKIRHASKLLSETKKTSGEISSLCGFNTTMYFCRIFKQISGMTPSDYRKRL